jgi:hypothetical protein
MESLMLNEYNSILFNITQLAQTIEKLKSMDGVNKSIQPLEIEKVYLEKSASKLYLRIQRVIRN